MQGDIVSEQEQLLIVDLRRKGQRRLSKIKTQFTAFLFYAFIIG